LSKIVWLVPSRSEPVTVSRIRDKDCATVVPRGADHTKHTQDVSHSF
jgi:hypothetical protein